MDSDRKNQILKSLQLERERRRKLASDQLGNMADPVAPIFEKPPLTDRTDQEMRPRQIDNNSLVQKLLAERRANRSQQSESLQSPQQSQQQSNRDITYDLQDNWAGKYQAAMLFAEQEIQKETISSTHREQPREHKFYDFPSQITSVHGQVQFANSVHHIQEELYSKNSQEDLFANPNELYEEEPKSVERQVPHHMVQTVAHELRSGKATREVSKQLIRDHQQEFQTKCTFQPNNKTHNVSQSRWEHLSRDRSQVYLQRQQKKIERDVQQILDHCSFRPNTNQFVRPKSANERTDQRLMREADKTRENREKLKRQLQKKELEECTFKPNINRKTSNPSLCNVNKFDQPPLFERAHDIVKSKQERVQQLRIEQEIQTMETLFKPMINQRSDKLASLKQQTPVAERLYNDAQDRINKLTGHASEQLECTFTPQLSVQSTSTNFQQRQEEFLQKREHKLRKIQEEKERQYVFKPKINETSEIIVQSDPARNSESNQDKYERLGVKDAQKRSVKISQVLAARESEHPFKPQINYISAVIAPSTSIIQKTTDGFERQKQWLIQQEEEILKQYSFKPQTNNPQGESIYAVQNQRQFSQQLKQSLKEKQARIAQARRQQEYHEIKDCTFYPQVNETVIQPGGNVKIHGLERHLELRELQKRKEQEQAIREAEVFGLNCQFVAGQKPIPFQLLTEMRHEINEQKFQERLDKLRMEQMKDCTFKPNLKQTLGQAEGMSMYAMNLGENSNLLNY